MAISQPTYKADLSYSESITADELTVKFDGVLYQVKKDSRGGYGNSGLESNAYASGLPFYIVRGDGVNGVFTGSAGQHTIEISEVTSKIETTECFKKAVKSVSGILKVGLSPTNTIEDATWQEAFDTLRVGGMVFLHSPSGIFPCVYVNWQLIAFARTEVDSDGVYTNTYTWNSDGTVTYASQKYPSQS